MKTTLLKMFRKRFEVIRFGEKSFALLDHKDQRVIYKHPGTDIHYNTLSAAISSGVSYLISCYESQKFITTRRKRMYRSFLTKK